MARLEPSDLLGAGEPLGEQMDERGVQVVDARAQPQQLGPHLVVSRATAHTPDTSRVCPERIGAAIVRQGWAQFPPHVLREYALLADGERGALCGPRGDIVWMCAPRWDSAAILSTLIGGSGVYAVTPTDPCVWGGSYEPGSLIWRNRWVTSDSIIECRDALAYPGDPDHLVLLRRVMATEHEARVRVVLDLRAEFGRRRTSRIKRTDDGVVTAETGGLRIRWSGVKGVRQGPDGELTLTLVVPPGGWHDLSLEVSAGPLPDERIPPLEAWASTARAWDEAVPEFDETVAPRDARHSYAVMRGMTRPGGGMVAATTLGVPERAEGGRNYDYRYVWLRDQAYAGLASAVGEAHPLLDDAVAFASARLLEHGEDIVPAYRIDGGTLPSEVALNLPGYPGGRDIVGNWVNGQFQLDAVGDTLSMFAAAAAHDHLDSNGYQAAQIAVQIVEHRWDEPEAGIWELTNAWWTESRLACVAGLRSLARQLSPTEGARLSGLADAILAKTSQRCLDERGFWLRSPDHRGTDASLLLPAVRGALPAHDPRTTATVEAVRRDLSQDGFVYRFQPDTRPLGEAEGAFLLCGFMMALAAWHQGDETEAFRWFERNRAACGTPGLLAEEYDVRQRQLRGNLPQAFVHAALLETAQRLVGPPAGD